MCATSISRAAAVLRQIADATEDTAARRGVTVHTELINADAPAQCAAKTRWNSLVKRTTLPISA